MAAKKPSIKLIKKAVVYRKFIFQHDAAGPTLEKLLVAAKTELPTAYERRQTIDAAASEFRLLSDWGPIPNSSAGFYGRLSIVQKGRFPNALADDMAATTIPLTAFNPPKGHDYAPGLCHFVVVDNHVVMTQSTLLRTAHLEAHLAWLFRDKTKLLTNQGFALSDEPAKATKERIRRSHVKSLKLGRPVLQEAEIEDARGRRREVFKANRRNPAFRLIKSFMTSEDFNRLGLNDGVFDSNLEVWIEIRYPKFSRSQGNGSIKLLDEISIALRDVDQDEITLSLVDGSKVSGKELKVSGHVDVASSGVGNNVSETDLYVQMRDQLRQWIKNDVVSV